MANSTKLIDQHLAGITGWRGEKLTQLRKLIHEVDPEILEEWKWSTPVFSHNGMVCAIGSFKDHVKINFFKGANLPDPQKLFNSGLESKVNRGIDFFENDEIDSGAVKELIKTAVDLNTKA